MSRATVELDFFGMEKQTATSKPRIQKFIERRRSFRDIQGAISKIDPEIIKSVIGQRNDYGNRFDSLRKSVSVPSTPKEEQPELRLLPVNVPITRPSAEKFPETAPLTIFFNGTVSIFQVPRDKADCIMKLAMEGCSKKVESSDPKFSIPSNNKEKLVNSLDGDLPIARRKSLHRFLEKRKNRLTSLSPYSSKM